MVRLCFKHGCEQMHLKFAYTSAFLSQLKSLYKYLYKRDPALVEALRSYFRRFFFVLLFLPTTDGTVDL